MGMYLNILVTCSFDVYAKRHNVTNAHECPYLYNRVALTGIIDTYTQDACV
ncbi:hypothetical protein QJS10_CPB12g00878 [Acorus calamus]|uniref:Uncharacterized protein n=1 Tax=Acorus calamus TaxID=4465 RepID=A0AAV9DMI4_ACOCL|nr:hypothetical protein QJS10_CPB12g00878 [Acorus calamus]